MIRAWLFIDQLKANGVTHAVGLPDNATAAVWAALRQEPTIRTVPVTREGEAFAIAAGLWVGGARPVVIVQNTGFLESGDAIRGCVTRMRLPLVCFISYRGYKKLRSSQLQPILENLTPENLSRADWDSCALLFEPTLKAWGIPYQFMATDDDLNKIAEAFDQAERTDWPVALLITEDTVCSEGLNPFNPPQRTLGT